MKDRFLKRLRKKAKKGMRGWPMATIAYYGPDLSRATKAVVAIMPHADAEPLNMRDWKVATGDIRTNLDIAGEMLEFIESYEALSVVMTGGIIGCPHQEGIDYEGQWCPVCEFWRGRDRFSGELIQ